MTKHVAVILGGWSSERDVSLVTGQAVAVALRRLGYQVSEVDATRNLTTQLQEVKPDIAFNALHGRWGEDGCVQGIFEVLNIPYTHSGVMASAVAMDKPMAKKLFERAGIPCAVHKIVRHSELLAEDPLPRPYVVKPINEGSSVGVEIIREGDNQPSLPADMDAATRDVMVEQYVPGRELACAVMGGRALGVIELRPQRGFYDYEAKYSDGVTDHLYPAPVPDDIYAKVEAWSILAHEELQCQGITRSDFRYDDTVNDPGDLYMLEINTQPGMTPLSLVPEMAGHAGISFDDLVQWMVEDASCPR
jgi:D-alanine-D-alanine ligase